MTDPDRPSSAPLGPVARRLAADKRVLCVEDEHDIADFLRAYFRASGYDLVHIDPESPEEILDALAEHEPDCVLLDQRLRGFNGKEAYRMIRQDDRWSFVPVIIVSAQDLTTPIDGGGLDHYVSKPFNTNTLADIVRDAIERAGELANLGRRDDLGVMSEGYLRARLVDEVAAGGEHDGQFSFALVQLRSLGAITSTVGSDHATKVVADLVAAARAKLPADVVMGLTSDDELAIVLPSTSVAAAHHLLGDAIEEISGHRQLPGGAEFTVDLSAGLAGYPEHALDADELYMAADGALADACDRITNLVVAL